MKIIRSYARLFPMMPKRRGWELVQLQETLRVAEIERDKLNAVLADIRNQTDGTVEKTFFLKTLMGLEGYSLRALSQAHRDFLSGKRTMLPETDKPPGTRRVRSSSEF